MIFRIYIMAQVLTEVNNHPFGNWINEKNYIMHDFILKYIKNNTKGKKCTRNTHKNNKYRLTSVLKVETDIITSFTESLIEQAVIPVLMYVEIQN